MENQFCKVGNSKPMTANANIIDVLEYQYQQFVEKASSIEYTDAKLIEFFEQKAGKIRKTLEDMML